MPKITGIIKGYLPNKKASISAGLFIFTQSEVVTVAVYWRGFLPPSQPAKLTTISVNIAMNLKYTDFKYSMQSFIINVPLVN